MTLKEKLEVEIMDLTIMSEVIDDIGNNLEYVVDDFAICFLNWYAMYGSRIEENLTSTELLKIYKEETGL